jgi:hypothetical protein
MCFGPILLAFSIATIPGLLIVIGVCTVLAVLGALTIHYLN